MLRHRLSLKCLTLQRIVGVASLRIDLVRRLHLTCKSCEPILMEKLPFKLLSDFESLLIHAGSVCILFEFIKLIK